MRYDLVYMVNTRIYDRYKALSTDELQDIHKDLTGVYAESYWCLDYGTITPVPYTSELMFHDILAKRVARLMGSLSS